MSPDRRFCPVPPVELKRCYFWLMLVMEVPSLKSRRGASFPALAAGEKQLKAVVSRASSSCSHHCCLQEGWEPSEEM